MVAIFGKMVENIIAAPSADIFFLMNYIISKLSKMRRPIALSAENRMYSEVVREML